MKLLDWKTGGIITGVLCAFVASMGIPLSITAQYTAVVGMLMGQIAPTDNTLAMFAASEGVVMFGLMLVLGLLLGTWISMLTNGPQATAKERKMPATWEKAKGKDETQRNVWALIGGALAIFGAATAGGAIFVHIFSGGLQLSIASFVFALAVFMGGMFVSNHLYAGGK